MFRPNRLDFENGITFTAIDSRDVDAMANALAGNRVNFTRGHTTVPVTLTDGSEATANAEYLAIDPAAGTAFVLGIYQKLIHG